MFSWVISWKQQSHACTVIWLSYSFEKQWNNWILMSNKLLLELVALRRWHNSLFQHSRILLQGRYHQSHMKNSSYHHLSVKYRAWPQVCGHHTTAAICDCSQINTHEEESTSSSVLLLSDFGMRLWGFTRVKLKEHQGGRGWCCVITPRSLSALQFILTGVEGTGRRARTLCFLHMKPWNTLGNCVGHRNIVFILK